MRLAESPQFMRFDGTHVTVLGETRASDAKPRPKLNVAAPSQHLAICSMWREEQSIAANSHASVGTPIIGHADVTDYWTLYHFKGMAGTIGANDGIAVTACVGYKKASETLGTGDDGVIIDENREVAATSSVLGGVAGSYITFDSVIAFDDAATADDSVLIWFVNFWNTTSSSQTFVAMCNFSVRRWTWEVPIIDPRVQ